MLAIIGSAGALPADVEEVADRLGTCAIDAGFRIVCGGGDGVMEAACRGARRSAAYREGDTVGVLRDYDPDGANPYVDVVIPSGLGLARNAVVAASGDAVIAVHGGSGTLSEIALAWQLGRPVIALSTSGGWSETIAGQSLDARRHGSVEAARTPEAAVALALTLVRRTRSA